MIGGGTAGLVTAAGLGARVALIERELLGGDCLDVACVPSNALIRAARAAAHVRDAAQFGIHVPPGVQVDFPAVMRRMRLGSNNGFLNALYEDALNRMADAGGLAGFSGALANGVPRSQVATVMLTSAEYHQDLVGSYYQRFLHRAADQGGLNSFANALAQGTSDQAVIAFIIGSNEYFARF